MEIIKRGTPPEEEDWVGECRTCRSTLRAKRGELSKVEMGDYRSGGPFAWEDCPVCKSKRTSGVCFYPEK